MQFTARTCLGTFGVITDNLSTTQAEDGLRNLLVRLEGDVQGDSSITDGHPRFFEHVTLMSIAEDQFGHADLVDQATTDAKANEVSRQVIGEIRTRFSL